MLIDWGEGNSSILATYSMLVKCLFGVVPKVGCRLWSLPGPTFGSKVNIRQLENAWNKVNVLENQAGKCWSWYSWKTIKPSWLKNQGVLFLVDLTLAFGAEVAPHGSAEVLAWRRCMPQLWVVDRVVWIMGTSISWWLILIHRYS